MSPEAIVACAGFGLSLMTTIGLGAYHMGRHANRIDSLERRQEAADAKHDITQNQINSFNAELSGVKATLKALEHAVSAGFDDLKASIQGIGRRSRAKVED